MGAVPNLELTTTEKEALAVYAAFAKKHGRAPGVREYARLLGVAPSWAWRLLRSFATKGALPTGKTTHVRLRAAPRKREKR